MANNKEVRPQEAEDNCWGCRITGALFGLGGGGYMAAQLLREPAPVGPHRAGILLAASFVFAAGMYRAFF